MAAVIERERVRVRPTGAALGADIDGVNLAGALRAHCTKPEFAWYQQWRAGDLILWDNRCVMHRRDAFDPATRRVMYRTQIKGDRPF
jgi:alpha-ketoglutarate-dependent taurine dioxygenase